MQLLTERYDDEHFKVSVFVVFGGRSDKASDCSVNETATTNKFFA